MKSIKVGNKRKIGIALLVAGMALACNSFAHVTTPSAQTASTPSSSTSTPSSTGSCTGSECETSPSSSK